MHVGASVLPVQFIIRKVFREQVGVVFEDQQVFRVAVFRRFREVERAGNDRVVVNQNDFVMRDGVSIVDDDRNPLIVEERSGAVLLCLL